MQCIHNEGKRTYLLNVIKNNKNELGNNENTFKKKMYTQRLTKKIHIFFSDIITEVKNNIGIINCKRGKITLEIVQLFT